MSRKAAAVLRAAEDPDALLRAYATALSEDPRRGVGELAELCLEFRLCRLKLKRAPIEVSTWTPAEWIAAWLRPDTDERALRSALEQLNDDGHLARHAAALVDVREDWQRIARDPSVSSDILDELRSWVSAGDSKRARKKISSLIGAHDVALYIQSVYPRFFAADEQLLRPLIDRDFARELRKTKLKERKPKSGRWHWFFIAWGVLALIRFIWKQLING